MKFHQNKYYKKYSLLYLYVYIITAILICYSFNIQVLNSTYYSNEVYTNTVKIRKITAARGNIVDRNNMVLAATTYTYDLYVLPYYFHDIDMLCANIKLDCDDLRYRFDKYPRNRILIKSNINEELSKTFQSIPGLFVFKTPKREYNTETATTHIVGYVGRIGRGVLETENDDAFYANDDLVGISGLEYIYNKEIHGLNGYEQHIVMANGLELLNPNRFLSVDKLIASSHSGNNLILSIDTRIQLAFAEALGNKSGAAVMMDIASGSIISLYSNPSYDPLHTSQVFSRSDYPLYNRAINAYSPGSTFKLITALAALELGIITPKQIFDCPGYYMLGGRAFRCWNHKGHGKLNLREAIKRSCDVYFFSLAQKVGLANINKYARMLGISQFTGIDLDGESAGQLPVLKNATGGDLLNAVIGQGVVRASPLQLVNAYATIVNGGELLQPKLVMNGEKVVLKKNNFKKKNIDFLLNAMYGVINEEGGTGYWSKSSFITIAGKTGSAQLIAVGKKGPKDNAFFVGLYPVINPKIAFCVFIENGEHGSSAIPIANHAVEEYAKHY